MGRTKVEIKKIEDRARRQTTFTKRRQGLFKKAGELCTKCEADVAVITFSMAGNVYAYGHPNVDSVIDRYDAETTTASELEIGERLKELQAEYNELVARSAVEERVGEVLEAAVADGGYDSKALWNKSIEDLGLAELEQLDSTIEEMRNKVVEHIVR